MLLPPAGLLALSVFLAPAAMIIRAVSSLVKARWLLAAVGFLKTTSAQENGPPRRPTRPPRFLALRSPLRRIAMRTAPRVAAGTLGLVSAEETLWPPLSAVTTLAKGNTRVLIFRAVPGKVCAEIKTHYLLFVFLLFLFFFVSCQRVCVEFDQIFVCV